MKAYTTITTHQVDQRTGLVTGTNETRLYYRDYPVFSQLPEVAQTQQAAIEWQAWWRVVKSKITIITVAHNQLEHTKRFLSSLRRFTLNELQIIIVNNASTDGTQAWLAQQEGLCVLNEEQNLGWVGAINKALDYIDLDSEFVIFANNDVLVTQAGWERKLLAHFDVTVGAVGPTSNYVAGRQNRVFDHPGVTEEEAGFLIGFFLCVPQEVIAQVGELDDLHSFEKQGSIPSGGDDLDYSLRIRNQGYRLVIARDVFVWHAGSQSLKAKLTDQEYQQLCADANQAFVAKWGEQAWEDLTSQPTRVLCAVPMRGDLLHRKFAFTFATLVKPFHFEVADIARAHIESSRTAAVKFARQRNFTHILFLDDDHILPADLFLRLYALDAPVACALAFQRLAPYGPCIYRWGVGEDGQIGAFPAPELIQTGVRKVDASGFSAVLIRMEVFEQLEAKKLPWFKWGELGEDLQFCLSCRDAGIDIYCDTDLVLTHIGENLEVNEQTYYSFNGGRVHA